MASKIGSLQHDIATALGTVNEVIDHSVDVIIERGPDIATKIDEAMGRIGLLVLIGSPSLTPLSEGRGALPRYRCECPIFCVENPVTNATGLDALDLAESVLLALHDTISNHPGLSQLWAITGVQPMQDDEVFAWQLTLTTTLFF